MKKILLAGLSALSFMAMTEVANAQELSTNISTSVTLTENVKLTQNVTLDNKAKLIINDGSKVTIDLNGFNLTQSSDNYAIDNKGELEIIDSTKKGMIKCTSNRSSCIRNYKSMTIKDISVNSVFTSVKNEEDSYLTITNSNLTSTGNITGTVMNYGDTEINGGIITATGNGSVAIFNLTYENFSSKTEVRGSTLKAPKAVETYYDDGSSAPAATVKNEVKITGGVIDAESTFNIREVPTSDGGKMVSDLRIGGEIEAPVAALKYIVAGSAVTINSEITGNITIPEGVEIAELADENQVLVENEDGTYSAKQRADYSKLLELLESLEDIDESLYTEESLQKFAEVIISVGEEVEEMGPLSIDDQDKIDALVKKIEDAHKELVKVDSADKTDDTIKEVPNTYDGIMLYVVIGIISLGTLGFAIKKKLFQ